MHWLSVLTGGTAGGGIVAGGFAFFKRFVVSAIERAIGGAVDKGIEPVKTKVNEIAEDVAHLKGVVEGSRNPIAGRHEAA
jgi:hypothetical protein